MPVVSVCPYCTRGRIRAADEDIGTLAKCPSCGSEFTVIPTEVPAAAAAASSGSSGAFGSSCVVPAVFAEDTAPKQRTPLPPPDRPTAAETLPDAQSVPADEDEHDLPDPARLPGLATAAVATAGGVAWLIPDFGRLVWLGLAVVALAGAAWCFLAADRRKRFAWVAFGSAGGSLLLCLLLPWVLGEGWWPARGYNANEPVALGNDGVLRDGGKEIDATKADWFRGGVRVRVVGVRREAVTITIPPTSPGKKATRKTVPDVFQVVIEVANDGAPSPPLFAGWTDAAPPALRTAGDVPVKAKAFDAPPDGGPPAKPQVVPSGTSVIQTLYFDPPPADAGGSGSLELPTAAFGGSGEPVKLMVPLRPFTRTPGGAK